MATPDTRQRTSVESERLPPPGFGPGHRALADVRPLHYLPHFVGVFLVLSFVSRRVEPRTDYGLQRVDGLLRQHSILSSSSSSYDDVDFIATQLKVTPEDVQTAQMVVDRYLDRHGRGQGQWPGRLIAVRWGDYEFPMGLEVLLNLVISMTVAVLLFRRQLALVGMEEWTAQDARFRKLNEQLEARVAEGARVIEQLNSLQQKLVQAEKLASIGRLSATLAHEIRNPLSIIKSSTEIVQEDLQGRGQGTAAIALIRDEITRMDRIISGLLNFARPRLPKPERHELATLVRYWIPPVVEELEKENIQLVPQLEAGKGLGVFVDADQLYQIFLNVVWNARDAVRGTRNPHIFLRVDCTATDFVRLQIRDTGVGMTPDVLRQISEPFFTTKTQGTGLGVPVSIQLLEGMGGRSEVESKLDFGTMVTLHLPLATLEAEFAALLPEAEKENESVGMGFKIPKRPA